MATFLFCFKKSVRFRMKISQLISERVKNFLSFLKNLSQLISEGNFFERHLNFRCFRCLSKGNRKIFEKFLANICTKWLIFDVIRGDIKLVCKQCVNCARFFRSKLIFACGIRVGLKNNFAFLAKKFPVD